MQRKRENIIQHLYNLIMKINIGMKTHCYLKMMKRHLQTIHHGQGQNTLTLQQHHGYECHQYSLYYGSKKFEKICFQYLHINMNHWILASLDPTNTHTPCILYDSKYDKILCENTTLNISKLLNIDHLNCIYANVIQQPNQS